ncbi:P-loop containing nucleoside triphosphate hydrolase protein [Chaetomium sp. MPI-SDFR-AT-0129]|nr:P-loop containing nucleoside triphosphate hydrolase protein [Chaetomium sp. MPI-SDFR-AT-0129]
MDPEKRPATETNFLNASVKTLSWSGLTVTVKDRETGQAKTLVENIAGSVQAGECCAVMGPSGCGKTTFLNLLAQRPIKRSLVEGQVLINGAEVPSSVFRHITSFVEDHDTFIDALNVRETLQFASRLAGLPRGAEAQERVDTLLESFGLVDQATSRIGTGISHGQKRRLTVAKQLVTGPSILFLDEPTSGLDSVASYHVISYLRRLAKRIGLVVICSIHQPSTSTFELFDKLLLLSAGKTHYFGATSQLVDYYTGIGVTIPQRANPADFLLELVNTDFAGSQAAASERERVAELASRWEGSALCQQNHEEIIASFAAARDSSDMTLDGTTESKPTFWSQLAVLTYRSFIKAYRDMLAYTARLAMYAALGVLTGTMWLQLGRDQDSIQLLVNALLVSSGFMSFLAVAYIPAFIEDYRLYCLDRRNGLYNAGSFLLSNFIVGLPYLFLFSLGFSVFFYWLANCQHSATVFFTWTAWLYLNLLAAEGIIIVCVILVPNLVGALIFGGLFNVLTFVTAGILVPPAQMNIFYKYVFYYWNHMGYVFQGILITQLDGQLYDCGAGCQCIYAPLPGQCRIAGETILNQYGVSTADQGSRNVGVVLVIILIYRLAAWVLLKILRR